MSRTPPQPNLLKTGRACALGSCLRRGSPGKGNKTTERAEGSAATRLSRLLFALGFPVRVVRGLAFVAALIRL